MSSLPDPHEFADEWIAAWNSHDLDRILSHYAADAVVRTPLAAVRVPESGGVVRGHAALRAYWGPALEAQADLRFTLLEAMPTVDGVTILYRNHRGQLVAETVLWGDDGLVHTSIVGYGATP
ncbi:MAG: nuclear transport factor 2 family protein [Actinobacteria bacterium]|nr:nuclear transport factor 2 family protein [Actinomycetota bacterium]